MRARARPFVTLASIGGACAIAHAGPGIASIAPVRRRLFPELHGLGNPSHIALTFDDGPDPASTPAFLELLHRFGWKATFFMLGTMARRFPVIAAEVADAGHEVALHGDNHRSHLLRLPGAVLDDIRRGYDSVAVATGCQPHWFRPPYGALSSAGLVASGQLGLRLVLWSAWGRDWKATAHPGSVFADVLTDLEPGATILLHDSDCTSAPGCWHSALDALPLLAERFAREGWTVGPLRDHGIAKRSRSAR